MRSAFLAALLGLLLICAIRFPFVGALVFGWISFMNPHVEVYGFAQNIPWAYISVLILLVGCLFGREPRFFALNGVTVSIVLMMILVSITSQTAIGLPLLVDDMWLRVIKIYVSVLLIAALLTDRWRIHAIIWLFVLCIGFYGVKGGLFTLATGGGFMVLGPVGSMIADRNHLAVALLTTLPLMNYVRLHSSHRMTRLALLIAMPLTLVSAIGTGSRGALVSALALGAVMWWRSRAKIQTLLAAAVAGVLIFSFMPDSWHERMSTMRDYKQDSSAANRVVMWEVAIKIAQSRPFVGGGFKATHSPDVMQRYAPEVTPLAPHSIWFEVLAEHGFLGFVVWFSGILWAIYYTFRVTSLAKGRPELLWAYDLARMAQVSIVTFCTGGTFLSLPYWDMFWMLLACMGAMHTLVKRELRQPAALRAARPVTRGGGLRGELPAGARARSSA